jgi:cellulose synthase/poly-beta-1,6-N-acetylglucosamine synthase-like glycosyltransferase
MNFSFEIYLLFSFFLIYIDILLILKVFSDRISYLDKKDKLDKQRYAIVEAFYNRTKGMLTKDFSNGYKRLKDIILFENNNTVNLEKKVNIKNIEHPNIRRLKSIFTIDRMEGAVYLGLIGTENARIKLEKSLKKERNFNVKLYIANALSDIGNKASIPVLVASLINSHRWYRARVNMLISGFSSDFNDYLPEIVDRKEAEIKELIVDFAAVYFSNDLKDYLIQIVENEFTEYNKYSAMDKIQICCGNCTFGRKSLPDGYKLCSYNGPVSAFYKCKRFKRLPVSVEGERSRKELAYKAIEILCNIYPDVLNNEKYFNSFDKKIREFSIKSLASVNINENFDKLISFLYTEDTALFANKCISEVIENNPEFIRKILKCFYLEENEIIKSYFADILSKKIEYLIMKIDSKNNHTIKDVIKYILLSGKTSNVIDFLNKNKNIDIENELVLIIRQVVGINKTLEEDFCMYLDERIVKKCNLESCEQLKNTNADNKDKNVIKAIYSIMVSVILLFPIIHIVRYLPDIFSLSFLRQLRSFVIDFNYYISYYSIGINAIYIILLLLSFQNVKKQSKLWEIKSYSLLFKKRLLPGVSLIAPAFNEEMTIIESANSLLNLIYPDYELIIVNDGSKDKTLEVLIKNFDLKRVDYDFNSKINTKQIRGVYTNRSMPNLIVVDKLNGGKADSLNAGINISRKEYFCGIDADSLLEPDALLKVASLAVDAGVETPALGGNVFPANGCKVDKGLITEINIPNNSLAIFQTIEYIRAFMAGRLGWAYLNNLLIISGAFGLFRKERVIDVGGYLTSSGKYEKDTVGEDMELVVRIARMMKEKKLKYKIDYAFNANCWTEVPEDLKTLKKQRYRWHKGLIDILTFHKKMIFNPFYGSTGLVSMPYFFIFEMIGPLIETQGYLMVVLAMFLGLLYPEIALLLFISTVLTGVVVSLSSLIIAERDTKYFKGHDFAKLIIYSIIENFGPRQLFSFWRVSAMIQMLWKNEGWNKSERKGFKMENSLDVGNSVNKSIYEKRSI